MYLAVQRRGQRRGPSIRVSAPSYSADAVSEEGKHSQNCSACTSQDEGGPLSQGRVLGTRHNVAASSHRAWLIDFLHFDKAFCHWGWDGS
jgi:hypothetical protein